MTSSPVRSSINSPTPAPSKSLFSRLKSPLQSKARNFTDFYIQPDDPHRQYSPGDLITGSVILKVIKPVRITHLTVSLHGYVQVFKNPNSPGDGFRNYTNTIGAGKGKRSGSYFGNGLASLFEDEAILCGEGRLGEGVYHFNFELEFPSKGLPSSIDFERGTVSYMITSTLTRPTTISPTTTCDTKVYLMENIDIAPIAGPKPRVVSLEPISRRKRVKNSAKRRPRTTGTAPTVPDGSEPSQSGRVSELSSIADESDTPGSPTPSDVSFDSQFSGTGSGTEYGIRTIATSDIGTLNGNQNFTKDKSITATIEIQKGGFLRGDQIPVRISVQHTKHVKSLHGIILTLYRQARVDMHPALPIAVHSKGDKTKSEDYYPKSKTGLGGLSLSGTGSNHLFRKDLSQSFAPLFVDPRTLTADVKAAVRVPEEAFPTIANVPGAMISFKYFVEVVVDIQGKLTGLDRMFPSSGLVSVPTSYGNTPGSGVAENATGSIFSTWGGNFLDTDQIRREKSVVSCTFEVVVGTRDSDRKGKKRQGLEGNPGPESQDVHEIHPDAEAAEQYPPGEDPNAYEYDHHDHYYGPYGYPQGNYPAEYYEGSEQPSSVPPPSTEREEELSEKERLRRAEARLLPSQPPDASGSSAFPSAQVHGIPPSAPILPEDDDPPYAAPPPSLPPQQHLADDDDARTIPGPSTTPTLRRQTSSTPSTITVDHSKPLPRIPHSRSSPAPDYTPASHVPPTDDKAELQRRRLELERSAPPEDPSDGEPSSPGLSTATHAMHLAPSAPVLEEEDEGLVGPVTGLSAPTERHGSILPPYER